VANFRKFVGSRYSARNLGKQIALEGDKIRQVTEGNEAYMSAELSNVVPGSIALGTYFCKYVHFLVPGRGWVLVFENLDLSIRVVDGPPAPGEGRSLALRCPVYGLTEPSTSRLLPRGEASRPHTRNRSPGSVQTPGFLNVVKKRNCVVWLVHKADDNVGAARGLNRIPQPTQLIYASCSATSQVMLTLR
jgi:hypothetical protein